MSAVADMFINLHKGDELKVIESEISKNLIITARNDASVFHFFIASIDEVSVWRGFYKDSISHDGVTIYADRELIDEILLTATLLRAADNDSILGREAE